MAASTAEPYGLGEPAMLEKIDKLFACGVGELVDLPQIVVVGDQSSGKSSVLEGLIQKPLPRDSGLCTRFATQIVFRRASEEHISVSIVPDRSASPEHYSRLKKWEKVLPSLDSKAFTAIINEVHKEMGLVADENSTEPRPTFSNDVLHLEISGPDQEHLSVIDVPGIFKSTTAGLTTKADILMVRNMVKGYMDNPRSVMLTVIPSNVDIATQEILELATEADPNGDRTLGVLTKPDLVDKGAEPRVIDLIQGRTRPMKLGWHMIRNPGQMELSDANLNRGKVENDFFRSRAPWSSLGKDKVGIASLRGRLKEVLSSLVKREFPKVKAEIKSRQTARRQQLSDLGPERASSGEQTAYLVHLAEEFQRIFGLAIDAKYGSDKVFKDQELRIAPRIWDRINVFSDEMSKYGEAYSFLSSDEYNSRPFDAPDSEDESVSVVDVRKIPDNDELSGILHPETSLSHPMDGIKGWLLEIFQSNRGFELGTFNHSILATAMKKQSYKWTDLSLGLVSDVVEIVHEFITVALTRICTDQNVREALINTMTDELLNRYQKAIHHTRFLLDVESNDLPMTLNHYFNDNLQKSRADGLVKDLAENTLLSDHHGKLVKLDAIVTARNMSNDEYVVKEIHNILQSYYKVSRKTFVDNVCKQVISHFLLCSATSPFKVFSPVFVSQLSTLELEEIAGEAHSVKSKRAQLNKELASLANATKILTRA